MHPYDIPESIDYDKLRSMYYDPEDFNITPGELRSMAEELLTLRTTYESTLPVVKTLTAQRDRAQERVKQLEVIAAHPSVITYRQTLAERDEAQSKAAELAERVPDLETERDLWKSRAETGQVHRDELITDRDEAQSRAALLEEWLADLTTEEWGIRFEKESNVTPTMSGSGRAEITQTLKAQSRATAEAAARNAAPISGRNHRAVRRFVTKWEEMPAPE